MAIFLVGAAASVAWGILCTMSALLDGRTLLEDYIRLWAAVVAIIVLVAIGILVARL